MESPPAVAYFTREGFPARVFECPRHRVTMMEVSCKASFEEAKRTGPSGRRAGCIGCPIGALHAGETTPAAGTREQGRGGLFCVRCRRSPEDCDDPRQVGKMRLVRDNLICVSCYNREREVVRQRNSKGSRPQKWAGLRPITVIGVADDGTKTVMTIPLARDLTEAILTMHRRTGVRMVYAAPQAPIRGQAQPSWITSTLTLPRRLPSGPHFNLRPSARVWRQCAPATARQQKPSLRPVVGPHADTREVPATGQP